MSGTGADPGALRVSPTERDRRVAIDRSIIDAGGMDDAVIALCSEVTVAPDKGVG
jgi:hypothetical protein